MCSFTSDSFRYKAADLDTSHFMERWICLQAEIFLEKLPDLKTSSVQGPLGSEVSALVLPGAIVQLVFSQQHSLPFKVWIGPICKWGLSRETPEFFFGTTTIPWWRCVGLRMFLTSCNKWTMARDSKKDLRDAHGENLMEFRFRKIMGAWFEYQEESFCSVFETFILMLPVWILLILTEWVTIEIILKWKKVELQCFHFFRTNAMTAPLYSLTRRENSLEF